MFHLINMIYPFSLTANSIAETSLSHMAEMLEPQNSFIRLRFKLIFYLTYLCNQLFLARQA